MNPAVAQGRTRDMMGVQALWGTPEFLDRATQLAARGRDIIDKNGLSTEDVAALLTWAAVGFFTNCAVGYGDADDKKSGIVVTMTAHALAQSAIMTAVGGDEALYGKVASYFVAVNLLQTAPYIATTGEFEHSSLGRAP